MHSFEVSQFKSFPFLRDEFFLEILSQFKGRPFQDSFDKFLFKSQYTYYQCYIQPTFNVGEFLASSSKAPPQCPFSRTKTDGKLKFIVDESVLRSKLSFFNQGRISVSSTESFETPNFQIVNLNSPITARDAAIYPGNHFKVNLDNLRRHSLVILSDEATFEVVSPDDSVIKALSEVKRKFTAADMRCLLSSVAKIHVFADYKLTEVLNTMIYAKIVDFPLKDALKSIPSSTIPSRLEPYLEILTTEYIFKNSDLFA